ncbi:MAG: hypothetical protein ACOC80_15715 [Petrotogales bacterium]
MEKSTDIIDISVEEKSKSIVFTDVDTQRVDRIIFDDSHDFCKWILTLARDMGLSRMDFAAGCNQVVDEIEDWGNL